MHLRTKAGMQGRPDRDQETHRPEMPPYRADLRDQTARKTRMRRRVGGGVAAFVLLALIAAGGVLWATTFRNMPELPETAQLWSVSREPAVELVTEDGQTLMHRGPRYGRAVTLDALPDHVWRAFVAGEDHRFFDHGGVDNTAIARAAAANLKAGRTVQGGSTLTQQLVKNLLLTPEQSLKRKAQEVSLAMQLEARITKTEILELYLNRIYMGRRAFGLDGAARAYFNKPAAALSLSEASFLAALPKAPSRLSAEDDLSEALSRRSYILGRMAELGYITGDEATAAAQAPVRLIDAPPYDPQLGHVADFVADQLAGLLAAVPADAVVTVTIDPQLQKAAHAALEATLRHGRQDG